MPSRRRQVVVAVAALLAVVHARPHMQPHGTESITTPEQQFGSAIGDDYFLATYGELESYWKQVDGESDRMTLVDIGRTEEGRTQWMAVISAPENIARLDRLRDIARWLAHAENLTDDEALALADEGKAVVWISGGLHATEVLTAQQLIETTYRLVSGTDDETTRILRDVVVLLVHANPDGHELVSTWYMREQNPRKRTLGGLPRLYQKYAGHDNNRDFYMGTQAETVNMSRVLFHDWIPQIVYDHHQAAVNDAVMVAPPFSGTSNYVLDPLVAQGIDIVGESMHRRFEAERKPGVTMGHGSPYSNWWNGGLRTTANFHNQVGILTETVGNPSPLPGLQSFRFRDAVEYSVTANGAVLDAASRYRKKWLLGIYRMGRNSIDGGKRDDPRGYIIPSNQPDFPTATKFVNALIGTGITVHRAGAGFTAGGRRYPAGSYVVKTAQAFRPHVLDMFEPQDHPDEVLNAEGLRRMPYDNAGWTLALQMGIEFDRVLEAFDGPFQRIVGRAQPTRAEPVASQHAAGYLVSHEQNDAAIAVNRVLKVGESVFWLHPAHRDARAEPAGAIYIPATPRATAAVEGAATDLGLEVTPLPSRPAGLALSLRRVRIGLVDRYGGWSTSGWIRWLLERYEFPFDVVYPPMLDAGGLARRYDVLILPSEAVPNHGGPWTDIADAAEVPPTYVREAGEITRTHTIPALKQFVEDGGSLLAIGRATVIARYLGLPVSTPLSPLPTSEFFVPGSVVRVAVDNTLPLGYGFGKEVDVFFKNSPVFRLDGGAAARQVRPVAWFTSAALRSGWAVGESHLNGTVAVAEATLGKGHVLLFGPEITFRAQSHATFKFLFNGIYYGHAVPVPMDRIK
jgi:hypothetical protein